MATAAKARTAKQTADAYFDAFGRRDADAMAACWAPDGEERIAGQADLSGPNDVRAYFGELFAAFPDLAVQVEQTAAQSGRVAVHWKATGTFAGPGTFQGLEPTGARVAFEGMDLLRVSDGLIVRNDVVIDGVSVARQIGLIPAQGSVVDKRMTSAFNARTRVRRRALAGEPERIADGVWLVRGGFPLKAMNVYLLEDADGVTVFDAGARAMTEAVATAAVGLGGINRVVLSHAHPDHRGGAAGLGAPVYCHPADRVDAESDGGRHYSDPSRLQVPARFVLPRLLEMWDGGPVEIAGTVEEGDDVAGFRVVHLPGHAPGMIGLFRESDRLALTGDCFYTINIEWGIPSRPRLPHPAFNHDTDQAQASVRKLAALEPSAAWPGHSVPVRGDVRGQLERAAGG